MRTNINGMESNVDKMSYLVGEVSKNHLKNIEIYQSTLEDLQNRIKSQSLEMKNILKKVEDSLIGKIELYLVYLYDFQSTVNAFIKQNCKDLKKYEAIYRKSPDFNEIIKFINFVGEEVNSLKQIKTNQGYKRIQKIVEVKQGNSGKKKEEFMNPVPVGKKKQKSGGGSKSTNKAGNEKKSNLKEDNQMLSKKREKEAKIKKSDSPQIKSKNNNTNIKKEPEQEFYFMQNYNSAGEDSEDDEENSTGSANKNSNKSRSRVKRKHTILQVIPEEPMPEDDLSFDDISELATKFKLSIENDKFGDYIISNVSKDLIRSTIIYNSEFTYTSVTEYNYDFNYLTEDEFLKQNRKHYENIRLTVLRKTTGEKSDLYPVVKLVEKFFKYFIRRKDMDGNLMFKGVINCDFEIFENYFTNQYKAFEPVESVQIDAYLYKYDLFDDYDMYNDKTNLHCYETKIILQNYKILSVLRKLID